MRYVVVRQEDGTIESFWCYYTDCDTCSSRFKCFTMSAVIVDDCINMTTEGVLQKLREHGIHLNYLAEF